MSFYFVLSTTCINFPSVHSIYIKQIDFSGSSYKFWNDASCSYCKNINIECHIWPFLRQWDGEGDGTPLQYSCVENPMDGGAWQAAVHGIPKNCGTSLSLFTFLHWRRKWQPTPVFLPEESQGWWAWWAAIYGVTQCRTRLKRLSNSSSSSSKTVRTY